MFITDNLLSKFPCHRMPERSLTIGNWHMPICSRCFGIILGFPFGLLIGYLGSFSSRWFGIIFLIPMFIDAGTQHMGYRVSNNFLRVVTGILGGVGIGIFILLWWLRDINLFSKLIKM